MALHIKGNRILTDEEYYNEDDDSIGGIVALMALCLSPGIILSSFIHPLIHFTTGQLWASVIIGCIIVMILMYLFIGLSFTRYMICSLLCAGFILIFTLCSSDNIFWNTTKALFEAGPYANKGEKKEKPKTSKASSIDNIEDNTSNFVAVAESAYIIPNKEELDEEVISANEIISSTDEIIEVKANNNEVTPIEEDRFYDIVEQMPSFPNGPRAMMEFLSSSVIYPEDAKEEGIQGRVLVTFVVERDGLISDAKVEKSINPSLDKEAVRLVQSMPRWNAGVQNGKPVRAKYTIPITFRL